MACFDFSTTFVWKFLSLKRIERDIKNIFVSMQSTRYFCQIFMKYEFSRKIFEKYLNIKFHENPSSGNRVVPCGRTDGRTEGRTGGQTDMTKLIIAFRNFANAPKKDYYGRFLYLNPEYV